MSHNRAKMHFLSKIILKLLKKSSLKKLSSSPNSAIGGNIKIGDFCNFSFYPNAKKISIGSGFSIRNYCNILVSNDAELHIGNNVFMNNYCSINCLEKIEIGENTLFGEGVKLYDHNHQYSASPDFKVEHQKFNSAPIKIGKNCWLGSNVIVLKGVTIGDNVIIGAGCVIHKDIPANSMIINKQEHIVKNL